MSGSTYCPTAASIWRLAMPESASQEGEKEAACGWCSASRPLIAKRNTAACTRRLLPKHGLHPSFRFQVACPHTSTCSRVVRGGGRQVQPRLVHKLRGRQRQLMIGEQHSLRDWTTQVCQPRSPHLQKPRQLPVLQVCPGCSAQPAAAPVQRLACSTTSQSSLRQQKRVSGVSRWLATAGQA